MPATTPLPVGVGYGVVVGVGFFFAFLMIGISYLQVSTVNMVYIGSSNGNTEPLHALLYQDKRGIQHCQQECEARLDR